MAKFSTRDIVISIKNKSINKTISNLQIRVVASKTLSSNPNQAVIEIYNLNQNTREELYNNIYDIPNNKAITEIVCTLDEKVLFQGQLINANSVYSVAEAEWKSTLYCGDGVLAFRTRMARKYEKGTTALAMIEDMGSILEEEGVAVIGAISGIKDCLENKSIAKALFYKGEVIANIKKILKQCFSESDVSIDDNTVNISIDKAVIPNNRVIINNGLIEPPSLSEQGINCKVVLDQTIKIGAEIQVVSKSVALAFGNLTVYRPVRGRISGDGIFRVSEVKHTVDNFSAEIAMTEIIGFNVGNIS